MNTVILVAAVWSARTMNSFIGELLLKVLPDNGKKIVQLLFLLLSKLVGLGAFLLYIYFAGYYIMDKEANTALSIVIAVIPMLLIYGYKFIFKKSAVIQSA